MPPRRTKEKVVEDNKSEQTAVRRSTRTRRSAFQDETDDVIEEPTRKRARSSRASASTGLNYKEEESISEQSESLQTNEVRLIAEQKPHETETPKKQIKSGKNKGESASDHIDTPHPKCALSESISKRTRNKRKPSETVEESNAERDPCSENKGVSKKAKLEQLVEAPDKCNQDTDGRYGRSRIVTSELPIGSGSCIETGKALKTNSSLKDDSHSTDKYKILVDHENVRTDNLHVGVLDHGKETKSEFSEFCDISKKVSSGNDCCLVNGTAATAARVKQPTGVYEGGLEVGLVEKDLTVASMVLPNEAESSGETSKAILEKLENPDIVAVQKSTPLAASIAEACGFRVFGNGSTRLLVRKAPSNKCLPHVEVEDSPETHSLIVLALKELEHVTSKSDKKRVKEYLTSNCVASDEFMVVTLKINNKIVTFVNVQLESKNDAVSSLLIGCLMQKLDSRPHAFILTGHMPNVHPGTPAYELLRDGYFGNHSIETLQSMRDIKMEDEEEVDKGLVDFFWKAYQHSRPWMRSVYETVLDGESVVSATGRAVIWHSTEGIEALRVFNHAKIVKADLAIRNNLQCSNE